MCSTIYHFKSAKENQTSAQENQSYSFLPHTDTWPASHPQFLCESKNGSKEDFQHRSSSTLFLHCDRKEMMMFAQFLIQKMMILLWNWMSQLVSWYSEPSQPQRVTSWLKTMFSLSPIYSARKSLNHRLSISRKINPDTNLHKTKHTQTSSPKFSKNKSLRYHPC